MRFVLTPDWFIGKDVFIEAFSFIVLLVFAFLAFRYFQLNKKNRNFLYLGSGFALIAVAQLATILTKLVLYYDFGPSQQIGKAIVITYQILNSVDVFYYIGFFFYRLLTLFGLYVIYRLPRAKKSAWDYVFSIYIIIISALLFQNIYYLFHLTALILLILIVKNYWKTYQQNNFGNTLVLIFAFSVLALSQLIFMLSRIDIIFVIANLIELVSYLVLLVLIIRILNHGTKKKSYGHNIRYVGPNQRKKRNH